jgi:hypothetical protein
MTWKRNWVINHGSSPNSLIEYFMKAWQGPGRQGRLRRKPCTVLVQGKHRRDIAGHNPIAGLPQSAAGAGDAP